MVICLEQSANDVMVHLMHCHPVISCFLRIQNALPFWCLLTMVVMEKKPLNGYQCHVIIVVVDGFLWCVVLVWFAVCD